MDIYVYGSSLSGEIVLPPEIVTTFKMEPEKVIGLSGSSYAIPVRGYKNQMLPLDEIELYVNDFLDFVEDNPNIAFVVAALGCEYTMLNAPSITSLFRDAPSNCIFDTRWRFWLGDRYSYHSL